MGGLPGRSPWQPVPGAAPSRRSTKAASSLPALALLVLPLSAQITPRASEKVDDVLSGPVLGPSVDSAGDLSAVVWVDDASKGVYVSTSDGLVSVGILRRGRTSTFSSP